MEVTVVTAAQTAKRGIKKDKSGSLLIRTENHNFLYGFSSGNTALKNLEALGVSSDVVDAAFLPCGQRVASGGLKPFLSVNFRAVVYARLNAFAPRFQKGMFGMKDASPDKSLYKNRRIHRCKNYFLSADESFATFSLPDGFRGGGSVGGNGYFVKNESGELLPDDFSHEMYLLVKEGKSWALFFDGAYGGIMNILRCAKRMTEKNLGGSICAIMGGFSPVNPSDLSEIAQFLERENLTFYALPSDEATFAALQSAAGERVIRCAAGDTVELVR